MNILKNNFRGNERKDEVEGTVYKTYDYDKFIIYEWNRNVSETNLKRIAKSVEKYGWKKDPIMVNEELGVIDGQHRLEFAKRNNLPLYYTIIKGLDKTDCQRMNSKRRAWAPKDYIKYYAVQGNEHYQKLNILVNKYTNIPLSTILYALEMSNSLYGMSGAKSNKLREGMYTTNANLEEAEIKLDYINKLIPYIKIIRGRQDQMERAILFAFMHSDIDNDRLERVVKENCYTITPPASLEVAFSELERIYNRNLKKGQVYLLTDWKKTVIENRQEILDENERPLR